ncbi:hypothetical protein V1477_015083, partial [Vespula maculifrons]
MMSSGFRSWHRPTKCSVGKKDFKIPNIVQFKIQQRNQIIRTNLILVLNNICIFSLKLHKCITPYEKTTDDDYNAIMTMTKSNDDYEYNYDTTTTATTTTTTTTTTTRRMMKHSWQT